jgi:hypothetical protein
MCAEAPNLSATRRHREEQNRNIATSEKNNKTTARNSTSWNIQGVIVLLLRIAKTTINRASRILETTFFANTSGNESFDLVQQQTRSTWLQNSCHEWGLEREKLATKTITTKDKDVLLQRQTRSPQKTNGAYCNNHNGKTTQIATELN